MYVGLQCLSPKNICCVGTINVSIHIRVQCCETRTFKFILDNNYVGLKKFKFFSWAWI